jgi:hypothetical protein
MEKKPQVKLIGNDGNAFFIIGACRRAAREAKWSREKIDAVMNDMMSGDYNTLLMKAMEYFDVK